MVKVLMQQQETVGNYQEETEREPGEYVPEKVDEKSKAIKKVVSSQHSGKKSDGDKIATAPKNLK